MVTAPNVLVFDVGSSALKAVVFDAGGAILARAEVTYPPATRPHRQSPAVWWQAALEAAGGVTGIGVGAIALTGTMENLIPVDALGNAIGDALLYSDPCGAGFLARQSRALRAANAEMLAGNAPEPLMTAFKCDWLCENEPERYAAAHCFLPGSKDFLALQMTGNAATDATCAATTGLMDISRRDWSEPLLELHGLERQRLPEILPAAAVVGGLTNAASKALNLPPGLPVINGCGDGGATTLGGGAEARGDISLYLGTTGWVARVAEGETLREPSRFYRLPHPLGPDIIEIAPILAAGAAIAWACRSLGISMAEAEELAAEGDKTPGDAVFLPYLGGERFPFTDLEVRAGFLGLSGTDGPGRLYYAVLEGVAFAIAANLEIMCGLGQRRVSLVGGGATSGVWPAILADVLRSAIFSPADAVAATSFGAFRLAQAALKLPAIESAFAIVARPRPERSARIEAQRRRFATGTALVRGWS